MEITNPAEGELWTVPLSKAQLRKEALERRNALSEKEKNCAAMVLAERILGHQWYYLSEYFLAYMPYGSEMDIREILEDAFAKGKKVYFPKVIGEEMHFFRISSLTDLQKGYKGILEPTGDSDCYVYEEQTAQRTLMLMPGAAFDNMRNRIGYGKGFYDRYLQGKEILQLRTIAVGFRCQMVEEIPVQETDIKPYQVILV